MIDQKAVEARLVERLRDQATLLDYAEFMQDSVDKRRLTNARKLLNDAADAIERLTASQARDEIVEACAVVADDAAAHAVINNAPVAFEQGARRAAKCIAAA